MLRTYRDVERFVSAGNDPSGRAVRDAPATYIRRQPGMYEVHTGSHRVGCYTPDNVFRFEMSLRWACDHTRLLRWILPVVAPFYYSGPTRLRPPRVGYTGSGQKLSGARTYLPGIVYAMDTERWVAGPDLDELMCGTLRREWGDKVQQWYDLVAVVDRLGAVRPTDNIPTDMSPSGRIDRLYSSISEGDTSPDTLSRLLPEFPAGRTGNNTWIDEIRVRLEVCRFELERRFGVYGKEYAI